MQPNPVFLPVEFHRQRSLAGYSLWSHRELDMTERLTVFKTEGKGNCQRKDYKGHEESEQNVEERRGQGPWSGNLRGGGVGRAFLGRGTK